MEKLLSGDLDFLLFFEDWQLGVETIKNFCLLRAESVRGQLDGTIPSTITAQAKGKSIFVDASVIWLPDMGEIADLKDGYHSQNPSEPSEGFLYTILTPPL